MPFKIYTVITSLFFVDEDYVQAGVVQQETSLTTAATDHLINVSYLYY